MVSIRRYKQKKLISKISDDFNFMFSSYAWLCVFHCSHRLLCWINSRVREFSVKIALISYWNASSQIPLGSVLLRGELQKYAKNSNFENFQSALYSTSVSMPLIRKNLWRRVYTPVWFGLEWLSGILLFWIKALSCSLCYMLVCTITTHASCQSYVFSGEIVLTHSRVEPSWFVPFLPDFSSFFLIFSWFLATFLLSGVALCPPPWPPVAMPLLTQAWLHAI